MNKPTDNTINRLMKLCADGDLAALNLLDMLDGHELTSDTQVWELYFRHAPEMRLLSKPTA